MSLGFKRRRLFVIFPKTRNRPRFLLPFLALALLACAIACGGSGTGSVDHLNDDDSSPSDDDDNDDDDNDDDVSPPADDDDDDSAPHWSVMRTGLPGTFYSVWGSSPSDVLAGGICPGSGLFLRYDGVSWAPAPGVPSTDVFGTIWGSSATDVYAAGALWGGGNVTVFVHFDGSSWSAVPGIPATAGFIAIWGSSATDVFAAGSCGDALCIYHYDGSSWSAMPDAPQTCGVWAIWGSSAADVFAAGGGDNDIPCIWHYDGSSWSAMTIPNEPAWPLSAVWGSSSSDVLASDGSGLWGSSSSDVFSIGDPSGILHYDGSSWSSMSGESPTRPRSAAMGTPASRDDYDSIWHYDGSTWSAMAVPSPPGQFDYGYASTPQFRGMWGNSPSDVFAVGQYGHGDTWDSIIYHYGY